MPLLVPTDLIIAIDATNYDSTIAFSGDFCALTLDVIVQDPMDIMDHVLVIFSQ